MRSFFSGLFVVTVLMGSGSILADDALMPTGCTVKNRSDAVVLVVCGSGLSESVWHEAGKAACGDRHYCNAWIWDDESKVPRVAPATDAGLRKVDSAAAVAVWINDSEMLMTLKRVR